MLNTTIVVTVTPFSGSTTPDKNGEQTVMLQCIAGTMPNRNVLAGTVARRTGLEIGKTYLVQVRENGFDKTFGPDFTFIKIMELVSGEDIVRSCKELGEARILRVARPEGFESVYHRKGDAVESNRTIRTRQGLYEPAANFTVTNHQTAQNVLSGTSINSGGRLDRELVEPSQDSLREEEEYQLQQPPLVLEELNKQ